MGWEQVSATILGSILLGLLFFPRDRYRYWWRWRDRRGRVDVSLSLLFFSVVNGLAGLFALLGSGAVDLVSDQHAWGRVLAALVVAQTILRGQAPRLGRTSRAEASLIGRASAWFIDDLDKQSGQAVTRAVRDLDHKAATRLAWWLHDDITRRDTSITQSKITNEARKIETWASAENEENRRSLATFCQETLINAHGSLPKAERKYVAQSTGSGQNELN